jgi:ribose/xylose/arabinose/galactoside ABC-type transport system permease subunit
VIGGVSLRGGVGTVIGALGGAFLLAVIDNGMQTLNLSSFLQDVVKGGILLIAVAADAYTRRPTRSTSVLRWRRRRADVPLSSTGDDAATVRTLNRVS